MQFLADVRLLLSVNEFLVFVWAKAENGDVHIFRVSTLFVSFSSDAFVYFSNQISSESLFSVHTSRFIFLAHFGLFRSLKSRPYRPNQAQFIGFPSDLSQSRKLIESVPDFP